MDNLKFCKVCKLNKEECNFINKQEDCYKCVYARKLKETKEMGKSLECKVCKSPLPDQRWKYCCVECASIGKRNSKHWTHVLNTDTKDWRRRFNFY